MIVAENQLKTFTVDYHYVTIVVIPFVMELGWMASMTKIKEVVLDESILDLDSWLPKEAVEQLIQIILYQENVESKAKGEDD